MAPCCAMFPLGSVALPGEALPLHVFEPRYRRLVLDCLADETGAAHFGTALIEHGHEVGGGDQRASVATIARIVRVGPLPGGRFEMLASAVGRATVLEWLPDDPYPIADVEPWPDRPPADDESFTARAGRARRACARRPTSRPRGGAGGGRPERRGRADGHRRHRPARRRPGARQLPAGDVRAVRRRRPLPGAAGAHRRGAPRRRSTTPSTTSTPPSASACRGGPSTAGSRSRGRTLC